MATTDTKVELDVERVFELLEHHDQFLRVLEDVIRGKLADERREHLTVVASEDDDVRTQRCRDCNKTFPYDPDADICPECVRLMHPDREEDEDNG